MPLPLSRQKALRERKLYFFVIPSVLLVATFSYFPAASAVYHSFFDWQGGDNKQFVGLANFQRTLGDGVLWDSFKTVSVLIVFNLFKMIPTILMAVLIHRLKSDRAQYLYRVLLVVPMIVPGLVTLFIWKFFFDPNLGVLNQVLDFTGIKTLLVQLDHAFGWGVFSENVPIGWLSQPELILPSLFIWGFPWIGAVGVLIYLAGLQSIGQEVYEAAELLRDKELFTLGVGLIYLDGEYVKQWGQIMAAYFIASVPLIVIFLFCMRLFVRGLSAGAIKG